MSAPSQIKPCLWFDGAAEEAANLYVSLLGGRITSVSRYGEGAPWPAGTAMMVEFELRGRPFQALNGGPHFRFTEAISMSVSCEDQAEIDRLWNALTEGGVESRCGWLKDRFGLSWQIVPAELGSLMTGGAAPRVMAAFMQMGKFDIATLRRAAARE